ncbi:hypothetical protein CB1_000592006 [Camelus ferus]|nr:hypothetical protein CB1_000592006 [Camelus ferus]
MRMGGWGHPQAAGLDETQPWVGISVECQAVPETLQDVPPLITEDLLCEQKQQQDSVLGASRHRETDAGEARL